MTSLATDGAPSVHAPRQPAASAGANERPPVIVFAVVLAVSFAVLLGLGHYHWFFHDDWDFIATRQLTDAGDLFRPHNEHWSTIPIVVYRLLYRVVGLRSYLPYQAVLVALHLTAAALLRVVMRRAGVRPWTATAGASVFALLGAGYQNIVWAFQIGFVASLVCGLAHLLGADHDGPLDRRDALGVAFGVVGLLCSGVSVTMTAVVGIAVLARRGWRPGLFHVGIPAACYLVWWFGYPRTRYEGEGFTGAPIDVAKFVGQGVVGAFQAVGQAPGVGLLIALTLVAGTALAVRAAAGSRHRLIAPAAMLVGACLFLAISGAGRVVKYGPEFARASRFVHLVAALTLPAIVVAADALMSRWRALVPVFAVVLVIVVAGNIDALADERRRARGSQELARAIVLEYAHAEVAPSMAPNTKVVPWESRELTFGFLTSAARAGHVPRRDMDDRARANVNKIAMRAEQGQHPAGPCATVDQPARRVLQRDDVLGADAPITVRYVTRDGARSDPMTIRPRMRFRALARMDVEIAPARSDRPVTICG